MNIGVMFGSRSTEHDVSITSAFVVMKKLENIAGYNVFPIYVSKDGKWIYDQKLKDIKNFKDLEKIDVESEFFIDFARKKKLYITQSRSGVFSKKEKIELDVIFPVFHGLNGEDGTIQGLCEMLQVPYVSPSIIGTSVGMNKIVMKNLFKGLGLPIVKHVNYKKDSVDLKEVESFNFPVFVKPANLGSSIGVSKVSKKEDLQNAVDIAFHYDTEIIIEEGVPNLIELNCSAMERGGEVISSLVEQPVTSANFLTFEEKYTSVDGGTMQGTESKVKIPAQIPDGITEKIMKMTKDIYIGFYCEGGAPRIDYLYDEKNNELYVNEINTIPGAMQMHLWEKSGISPEELVETLVKTAIEKQAKRKTNIDFKSNIIDYTMTFINK